MEYGRIIKRAIDVTWRNKVLWIFGIAIALFSGGSGGVPNFQFSFNRSDVERWFDGVGPRIPFSPSPRMGSLFDPALVAMVVVAILAFALVLFVASIIVRYTGEGALIGMVNEIEEVESTNFRSGLRTGWSRLLRLFAIDLLIGIVIFAVLVVLVVIAGIAVAATITLLWLLFQGGEGLAVPGGIATVIGLLLFILVAVAIALVVSGVVTIVREMAFRTSVIERRGVFDSLGAGIALLRTRLRETGLMWLLLLAINLAVGIVTAPLVLLGIGVIIIPALIGLRVGETPVAALLAAGPFILLLVVVGALLAGVYTVFQSAVWTLTFRELQAGEIVAEA
ncbi:MAG: DUF7544 domain-containing protein [Anaerolineae bacterium]|jgi:hypothetical protein